MQQFLRFAVKTSLVFMQNSYKSTHFFMFSIKWLINLNLTVILLLLNSYLRSTEIKWPFLIYVHDSREAKLKFNLLGIKMYTKNQCFIDGKYKQIVSPYIY